jgi:hypothetical protein
MQVCFISSYCIRERLTISVAARHALPLPNQPRNGLIWFPGSGQKCGSNDGKFISLAT